MYSNPAKRVACPHQRFIGILQNKSLADPVYQSVNQIIANKESISTMNRSHANGLAQVAERTGLAIMGALSGLYVSALAAKIDIGEINSAGVLLVMMLYGSVGFYLGTDLLSLPSDVSRRVLSDGDSRSRTNLLALASATGTLVAALAALVSVSMIVLDEIPPVIWNVAIVLSWMLGVLLQLGAGTGARLGQFSGAAGGARCDGTRGGTQRKSRVRLDIRAGG